MKSSQSNILTPLVSNECSGSVEYEQDTNNPITTQPANISQSSQNDNLPSHTSQSTPHPVQGKKKQS